MSGARYAVSRHAAHRRHRYRRAPAPVRFALAAIGVAILLTAGWLWVRDSSVVAVREVAITGATSSEQARVRSALSGAARDMTTLHVDEAALHRAVAPFASVAGLRVETDLPHRIVIQVLERAPVAVVTTGAERIPVTADGRLLRGVEGSDSLPAVALDRPATTATVRDPRVRAALTVLGGAPTALRLRVERVRTTPRGLTLDLREGPTLYFGDARRPRAKWAAAARVLADPGAAGALYLDVRLPERTAAGGVGPVTPEERPAGQEEVAATATPSTLTP